MGGRPPRFYLSPGDGLVLADLSPQLIFGRNAIGIAKNQSVEDLVLTRAGIP